MAKLDRRKRLVLSEQALAANIRIPEFLEEIFNEPDDFSPSYPSREEKLNKLDSGTKSHHALVNRACFG